MYCISHLKKTDLKKKLADLLTMLFRDVSENMTLLLPN